MTTDAAALPAAEYVEVCFPAWPAPRGVATSLAARLSRRIAAGPLEIALFVVALVAVPGALAALSVLMLTFLLAFVLLAPGAFVLLTWLAWRHDRRARA